MSSVLSISILFISLVKLINHMQFLNTTPLFFSSDCLSAALFPSPVIVILHLPIGMHHYNHIN